MPVVNTDLLFGAALAGQLALYFAWHGSGRCRRATHSQTGSCVAAALAGQTTLYLAWRIGAGTNTNTQEWLTRQHQLLQALKLAQETDAPWHVLRGIRQQL